MSMPRRTIPALAAGCLALACAQPALAAGPAVVTVRVEGVSETLVAPTLVTTSTEPVVNGGQGSCPGTSAIGALQIATGGNWTARWELSQYFVQSIEGEGEMVGASRYYWSFWLNDVYASRGACEQEAQPGDRVLFFPICETECPPGAEPVPLEIEAPSSAAPGEAVPVIVSIYNKRGEGSPAAGAQIEWPGGGASADAQGHAALSFAAPGAYTVRVRGAEGGPPAVRAQTTVCVHPAGTGACAAPPAGPGSPGSGATGTGGQTPAGPQAPGSPQGGPDALLARITGIREGRVYARRHAPRVLAGSVNARSQVTSVRLALRRRYRSRCWSFDGARERFRRARCGRAVYFKLPAAAGGFSYLLPEALRPGRYVLDLQASDAAGSHTKLAPGTSQIAFYVR